MSRPTTKGFFVKERLHEARLARGLTQKDVALAIGCSTAPISKWEKGTAAPAPDALDDLAKALGVAPGFFTKEIPTHGGTPIFFRSLANAAKKARNREEARVRWLQDISLSLQEILEFPSVDVPDLMDGRTYKDLCKDDLEEIALALRQHWGCGEGPLSDILLLCENAGVVVGLDHAASNAIDGQGTWSDVDSRPYMLLATDKENAFRRAMDCAHELSHIVLHSKVTEDELKNDFNKIEEQAKYLAGSILLPYRAFSNEIYSLTLDGFLQLKPRWGVSVGAMIFRSFQLEIISDDHAKRLWRYRTSRGWHRKEPLDSPSETPVPKPKLLKRSIELLVSNKIRSKRDLLEQDFCLGADDVEMLASLESGYFAESPVNLVPFEPKVKQRFLGGKDGEVIPFRRPT